MRGEVIKIPACRHMAEWLRFIRDHRNTRSSNYGALYLFDFRATEFLYPYHLVSLACLIQEYKQSGAKIKILCGKHDRVGQFVRRTKFNLYWRKGFDKNYCMTSDYTNTIPIWKYKQEYIDAFANMTQKFYSGHSLKGKDLGPLRLTVVEALNNITDHSLSKVSGFVATQYFASKSQLVISICDFGVGIPTKVNRYLASSGNKKITDIQALRKSFERGFSTRSTPQNRGFGLDNIISHIKASDGEIEIVSNKAYLWKQIRNSNVKQGYDELEFSFPGTYLVIKLNTSKFEDAEPEIADEIGLI